MAAMAQVPRFLAVAPGADLGSRNESTIAAHGSPLMRLIHRE